MSCKLPESDTGIINPLKEHLDKKNRDQIITRMMGWSPSSQCSKMLERVNTEGKTSSEWYSL